MKGLLIGLAVGLVVGGGAASAAPLLAGPNEATKTYEHRSGDYSIDCRSNGKGRYRACDLYVDARSNRVDYNLYVDGEGWVAGIYVVKMNPHKDGPKNNVTSPWAERR